MSGGVATGLGDATAAFYGEKLRDAQRKFYETLGTEPGASLDQGTVKAKGSVKKVSARSRVTREEAPVDAALPGVPAVEASSPSPMRPRAETAPAARVGTRVSVTSGKRPGGYEAERSSPKENHRYGPERFFYDQRSYTGVHRNGPPTTVEKEVVQEIVRDVKHGTSPVSRRSRATSTVSFRSRSSSVASISGSGRRHTVSGEEKSPRYGPERFFYDQHTYTGAHRSGGPSVSEGPKDLSQLLRREPSESSPRSARSQRGSVASMPGGASRASFMSMRSVKTDRSDLTEEEEPPRSARLASRVSNASLASEEPPRSARLASRVSNASLASEASPRRPSESSPQSARSSKANLEAFRYGPERFFYDSRTYTGVHKNGGPTNVDVRNNKSESQEGGARRPSNLLVHLDIVQSLSSTNSTSCSNTLE